MLIQTYPVSGAANKEERSGDEPMVINMLLCYVTISYGQNCENKHYGMFESALLT